VCEGDGMPKILATGVVAKPARPANTLLVTRMP
jgi:hypothetical protein